MRMSVCVLMFVHSPDASSAMNASSHDGFD